MTQTDQNLYLRTREQLHTQLGRERADALESEGHMLSPTETLALAEASSD